MFSNLKLLPYNMGSDSARALARTLGIKRVTPQYKAKRRDIIINWGNKPPKCNILSSPNDLNKHEAIATACNKLRTFQYVPTEFTPHWTTLKEEAKHWVEELGPVYCRTLLSSHSGRGIVIANTPDEIVEAPLYTVATKHKYEFRVHVFKGSVIDVQQKKRRLGYMGANTGIRNHSNGYIYARSEIIIPEKVLTAATESVTILGLDFGACDIGYRERDNKAFLFEVNTAPGLTGTTLQKYANAFRSYYSNLQY